MRKRGTWRIFAAALALTVAALVVLSACAPKDTGPKKLVVWSFSDELGGMLDKYKALNPDVEIEFVMVPNDVYQSKLKPVLQSGQGAPDVFALEAAYIKGYVDTGFMLDLAPIASAAKDTVQYTKDAALDSRGKLMGLSWQATPGAYFYRRSMAKKYLGTDDPVAVQAMLSDFDKFLDVAEELKQKSGGRAVIVSSVGDLFQVYKSGRTVPWVKDGVFGIDPLMVKMMEQGKLFHDNDYEGRQAQWGEGWFAGMKGTLTDESGAPVEVFGYFLPTWGLHYVLKANAKAADGSSDTSGDWAMIQGPMPYFWGGTWLGAFADTKQKDLAMDLIRFLTTDPEFLEPWAKETGDLVSNMAVVNKIKDSYVEPFLSGQNHYAAFADMARNISAKVLTGYDQEIEVLFQEQMNAYVNGEKPLDEALADFKAAVASQFTELSVQ